MSAVRIRRITGVVFFLTMMKRAEGSLYHHSGCLMAARGIRVSRVVCCLRVLVNVHRQQFLTASESHIAAAGVSHQAINVVFCFFFPFPLLRPIEPQIWN